VGPTKYDFNAYTPGHRKLITEMTCPVVVPIFKFGWWLSQARDGLPKRKRKLGVQKFLELARSENYQGGGRNSRYGMASEMNLLWGYSQNPFGPMILRLDREIAWSSLDQYT
jgi:hypothetical protein